MTLAAEQIARYARHLLVPEVGRAGQERLLASSVTVTLRPGDGAAVTALAYLAAAGIGTLHLAGNTTGPVTAADLSSTFLYHASDLDRPRASALIDRLHALNPSITVTTDTASDSYSLPPEGGGPGRGVAESLIAGCASALTAIATLASPPR
jgi:adenylyltransferase/sulfurtransferase